MSQPWLGKKFTLEHRLNISKGNTGKKRPAKTIEQKEKQSKNMIEYNKTKNPVLEKIRREKISKKMTDIRKIRGSTWYKNPEERRKLSSIIMKKRWGNPEYAKKIISLSRNKNPNKCESSLLTLLKHIDSNWEFVGNGKFIIGNPPKCPDFINRKERQIIEFFGEHWHKKEEELKLVNFYKSYGFNCVVLWDYEIKKILKSKYTTPLKRLIMTICIKQLDYIKLEVEQNAH